MQNNAFIFFAIRSFREQCRWVQMHTTNMCFDSHLHSNNRREEKLSWTTLNGHFLAIYTILNLQTVPVENELPMETYTHTQYGKHIEIFFLFQLKKCIYIKHCVIFICCSIYHSHFSRFSIWSSRPAIVHEIYNSQHLFLVHRTNSRQNFLISTNFPY